MSIQQAGPSHSDPDHHPAAERPDPKALHVESQVNVLTVARGLRFLWLLWVAIIRTRLTCHLL